MHTMGEARRWYGLLANSNIVYLIISKIKTAMYTIIIRILTSSNTEKFELVQTDSPGDFFADGKITRQGLAALLAEESFGQYTLDQLQYCECVRTFLSYSIKTIYFKDRVELKDIA